MTDERRCVDCGVYLSVLRNSSQKRCDACLRRRRAVYAARRQRRSERRTWKFFISSMKERVRSLLDGLSRWRR